MQTLKHDYIKDKQLNKVDNFVKQVRSGLAGGGAGVGEWRGIL